MKIIHNTLTTYDVQIKLGAKYLKEKWDAKKLKKKLKKKQSK